MNWTTTRSQEVIAALNNSADDTEVAKQLKVAVSTAKVYRSAYKSRRTGDDRVTLYTPETRNSMTENLRSLEAARARLDIAIESLERALHV